MGPGGREGREARSQAPTEPTDLRVEGGGAGVEKAIAPRASVLFPCLSRAARAASREPSRISLHRLLHSARFFLK
eukprot:7015700-Pyramimonas_sp.AAC.2